MSAFLTELECRLKDEDGVWIIDAPLVYQSDLLGKITVPAGFETNFASVPRTPIIYSLFGDKAHRESVIHDLLYRKDAALFIEGRDSPVCREDADCVFYEAMKCRGKSLAVRYGMFWGVRIGGGFSFHKNSVMDKIA